MRFPPPPVGPQSFAGFPTIPPGQIADFPTMPPPGGVPDTLVPAQQGPGRVPLPRTRGTLAQGLANAAEGAPNIYSRPPINPLAGAPPPVFNPSPASSMVVPQSMNMMRAPQGFEGDVGASLTQAEPPSAGPRPAPSPSRPMNLPPQEGWVVPQEMSMPPGEMPERVPPPRGQAGMRAPPLERAPSVGGAAGMASAATPGLMGRLRSMAGTAGRGLGTLGGMMMAKDLAQEVLSPGEGPIRSTMREAFRQRRIRDEMAAGPKGPKSEPTSPPIEPVAPLYQPMKWAAKDLIPPAAGPAASPRPSRKPEASLSGLPSESDMEGMGLGAEGPGLPPALLLALAAQQGKGASPPPPVPAPGPRGARPPEAFKVPMPEGRPEDRPAPKAKKPKKAKKGRARGRRRG